MKTLRWHFKMKTTYGALALSLFSFVILSGVLLAIPFNVEKPYSSISTMLVMNPWASFIRNIHYWSAQFFLLFSLLHLYDHYHKKNEVGLKKGMAFRLSLGVLIIFLAMLTGFLLKGDADSIQARQILYTLSERIPVFGKLFALSLLGKEGSYQLIYVNHIATFTIFLAVIIVEHSKKFWPKASDFILVFIGLVVFSYFFSAPLHDDLNPTVKGPWYFVGFQEMLHWLSHPEWSLAFILFLLVLVYIANTEKGKTMFFSKRTLLVFTGIYLVLTVIGLFFRGENWKWITPGQKNYAYSVGSNFRTERVDFFPDFTKKQLMKSPTVFGRKESCLVCHDNVHGFTQSHKPKTIGCFSCHEGNPFATSAKQAHHGMILIPGNMSNAAQTCGTAKCHPDIVQKVPTSLMDNLSGMISVDRYVFGEQKSPNTITDVSKLGHSAADQHLKNLCIRCHLGNPKTKTGPVTEKSRGGGCLACHLTYKHKALLAWEKHEKEPADTTYLQQHAEISLDVSSNHCFGCHSRSARISTSYEGWEETLMNPKKMPDSSNYRLVEGNRVFKYVSQDIHHKLGMECIDCHNSYELMGDGTRYAHEEDQENVQCIDCHFSGKPDLTAAKNMDNESATIAALRFGSMKGKEVLTTHKKSHPLINTWYKNDTAYLITKITKKVFAMKPPAAVCTRDQAHKDVSCSACHSTWAPTCIGCHNAYKPNEMGYNMLTHKMQKGTWVEYTGSFKAQLPALGVRITNGEKEVIPVIPGMILSIDKSNFTKQKHDSLLFRRLFAPIAPHTTTLKGRSCKSCHNNPDALGYGLGKLTYEIKGQTGIWKFDPYYANSKYDNLPEDAWIGFLKTRTGMVSTRTNVKPFSVKEQHKILLVGACLTCHKSNSAVMKESQIDFHKVLKNRSSKCVLPDWQRE